MNKNYTYLVTISSQQKKNYVSAEEIMEVISYLQDNKCQVTKNNVFEVSGKYNQLHWHGIVVYNGRWSELIAFGDLNVHHNTFRIQWKRITTNIGKVLDYLSKDLRREGLTQAGVLALNYYRHHYNNSYENSPP